MTLRVPNNPLDETTFLTALVPLIPPNTQLALGSDSGTGVELVYVHAMFMMSQGNFPAILLSSGGEDSNRISTSSYEGVRTTYIDYYNRWDVSPQTLTTIRNTIRLELARIESNLISYFTNNEGLLVQGVVFPVSLLGTSYSAYNKQPLDKYGLGLALGAARLTIQWNMLPYSV